MPDRGDWRERAACRGKPSELFFPPKPLIAANYRIAKAICETCEVREQCLALVIRLDAMDDRWGMFGGMTPSERRRLRSDRAWRYALGDGAAGPQRRVRGQP